MARFSATDPKYNGLSTNEKIRQAERDNLLFEQTEQLKRANDLKEKEMYGEVPLSPVEEALYGSKLFALWFCTLVFGGLIIALNYTTDIQIKLPGGNIPLYIYIGILVIIPILGILRNILNKCNLQNKTQNNLKEDVKNKEDKKRKSNLEIYAKYKSKENEYDKYLINAISIIVENKMVSCSTLQRKLKINYDRAEKIINQIEELGIISSYQAEDKPRQILITEKDWKEIEENI